jgi:membrane-bound ClpP family serine protease
MERVARPHADQAPADARLARLSTTALGSKQHGLCTDDWRQPMIAIARLVRSAAWIVALVILAGIVLVLLDANMGNAIVRGIHDAASFLVGPFKNVFSPKSHKANIAVNWGLAAVVYLLVGSLIAGLLVRMAPRGVVRTRAAT